MKTISKNEIYLRVSDEEADLKVKTGWKFVAKNKWKSNVRDLNKEEVKPKKEKK